MGRGEVHFASGFQGLGDTLGLGEGSWLLHPHFLGWEGASVALCLRRGAGSLGGGRLRSHHRCSDNLQP